MVKTSACAWEKPRSSNTLRFRCLRIFLLPKTCLAPVFCFLKSFFGQCAIGPRKLSGFLLETVEHVYPTRVQRIQNSILRVSIFISKFADALAYRLCVERLVVVLQAMQLQSQVCA